MQCSTIQNFRFLDRFGPGDKQLAFCYSMVVFYSQIGSESDKSAL